MGRLLNQYDKESMKIAMLKHEETFREQVYELHRLYRIQKVLMRDIARTKMARTDPHCRINSCDDGPESRPVEEKCRVECVDQSELELTLGPRSYYQKKIKAAEPGIKSGYSGPSFSSSSSGSSHVKGEVVLRQQKWGPETQVSGQDRLNSPPWLFQALSLNMT